MANFRALGGSYIPMEINNSDVLLSNNAIITPTLATGVNNYMNTTTSRYYTYYYKLGSRVFLSVGCYQPSGGSMNKQIFTLPQGYRPYTSIYSSVRAFDGNDLGGILNISDTGDVTVTSSDRGGFGTISFDAFQ